MSKKADIIATILVIIIGGLSIYYAYTKVGARAGRMTIASCGIILYLLIRDYRYKKEKEKEEIEAKSGGHKVISLSKSKSEKVNIGNIAHHSTKDRDLRVNNEGSAGQEDIK